MSWHYLPELLLNSPSLPERVGDSSAPPSLAGVPSAPWKSSRIAGKCSSDANGTVCCPCSRSGMTCAHSTGDPGVERWMSSLGGSRVKTSVPQERAQALLEQKAGSGQRWPGSLAKYDPATHSWRTHQYSLLGGLTEFSGTWPRWGWMRDGELFLLPPLVPRTKEKESGFWPTPAANEYETSPEKTTKRRAALMEKGINGNGFGLTVGQAVHLWATPCTPNGGRTNRAEDIATRGMRADGRKVQVSLESQAKAWSTPRASTGEAAQWATPQARDHFPPHTPRYIADKKAQGHGMRNLTDEIAAHAGVMEKSRLATTEHPGSLNPDFHLWLMGWPIGWTALEPLAMDKFHEWWSKHGNY